MIVYLLLFLTLLPAIVSLLLLHLALQYPLRQGYLLLMAAAATGLFIYLYGAWFYISFYLQYVFAALFALVLIYGLLRRKKVPAPVSVFRNSIAVFFILIFGTLSILYFTGTTGDPHTVNLHFPFRQGNYLVMQGGKGLPTNLFHYNQRKAVYAMDLVKLNNAGQRASHLFSTDPEDYFIFGDTVYSPCDGTVMRAIDDNTDNTPPERKRGPHNLNGVLIEADHFYVFMGHLKFRSVFVHKGDRVTAGMPVGLAGNSGFSIEPHLHIQAHQKQDNGKPWYEQEQLYIQFDKQEYLLFQLIKAAHSSIH